MKQLEFLNIFKDFIDVGLEQLTGEEQLEHMDGWDSLGILEFIAFCDKRLNFVPTITQIESCKTINDLIVLLDGRVN